MSALDLLVLAERAAVTEPDGRLRQRPAAVGVRDGVVVQVSAPTDEHPDASG